MMGPEFVRKVLFLTHFAEQIGKIFYPVPAVGKNKVAASPQGLEEVLSNIKQAAVRLNSLFTITHWSHDSWRLNISSQKKLKFLTGGRSDNHFGLGGAIRP